MAGAFLAADEPSPAKLVAPAGWDGETIQLPPGFSPEMKLKGSEHIRFAPGMMDPESDRSSAMPLCSNSNRCQC